MKRFSIADCRLPIADFGLAIANSRAFSLVEVVLAIGIVSFALLAVTGLMPVGLKSVKNANDQAGAANVLNVIADRLRAASSTNSSNYSNSFAGTQIAYAVGGSVATNAWSNLTLEGTVDNSNKRLAARLDITPPVNLTTPGRATVSVAWSAQANPTWSTSSQSWANAEGSITSGIQFLPRQ
jgi:uncharacterized protein (TIGR02598 family)